ncbi:hypothetical protein NPIL_259501 [Nephila pilipes]|uniref:Uncharacterized protein n=1 Tax=Nephila pilipes TaxID=299642 RepID=A0A8X6TCR7_NEPPI|nr:hypothetical protein NPIL_259501 [Nephila pilipes]
MLRRAVGKINLSEREIFQLPQNIPETDSGLDEKSDLSNKEYIPEDGKESTSADERSLSTQSTQKDYSCDSENEEVSFINTDSQQVSTALGRNQIRNKGSNAKQN